MATTVQVLPDRGQYRRPSSIPILAAAWGCESNTAKQLSNPADPRCPWTRAAIGTDALMRAGLVQRAEELCAPLDRARLLQTQPVTLTAVRDALIDEQSFDNEEDLAQVALLDGLTPGALDTWLKRARRYLVVLSLAVRLTEAWLAQERR